MTILSIALACSAPTSSDANTTAGLEGLPSEESGDSSAFAQGGQPGDFEPTVDTGAPDFEPEGDPPDFGAPICEGNAVSIGDRTYGSVQAGLDHYMPADPAMWVCPGVYTGSYSISANYEINIRGASGDPDDVMLVSDGGSTFTVFAWRGGAEADPARFVLTDVTVVGGSAEAGGAIYVAAQEFILDSVTVMDGVASYGGGVFVDGDTRAVIFQDTSFLANSAIRGGAVFVGSPSNDDARVISVGESDFWSNTATESGGAVYLDDGGLDAVFLHTNAMLNEAPEGGAYYFSGQKPTDISHVSITGGGVTQTVTESGAVAAGGVVSVITEDVDFGMDGTDNDRDVQGCEQDFGPGASFLYSMQLGQFCELY